MPEEVLADLLHFAQVVVDVVRAQQANVQPQVFAKTALDAVPGGDVLFHPARYHVPGGQLFFLRFVVGHEAVLVAVQQQAAVTATALGDQDPRREYTGGVKLDGLHVAQGGHAGFQRDGGAHALVDDRVGRDPVDAAEAAGGDAGGPGHVGQQFTGHQVAHDGAVTAPVGVNQRQRLHALVYRNIGRNGLVAHGVEHGVAGAVRDVTGAPFLGAAEVAAGDQAVGGIGFRDGFLLAVDGDLTLPAGDPVPGHAPGGQLPYRLGGRVGKHAHHFLVRAPVAAAHGVGKVNVLVVTGPAQAIAQAGLHAALGGGGMGAFGGYQAEDDDIVAAAPGADRRALSCQAAADHQHIRVNYLHELSRLRLFVGRDITLPGVGGVLPANCHIGDQAGGSQAEEESDDAPHGDFEPAPGQF